MWGVLLIIAAALLLWIVFLGILFPATDFDGNSYHLTFIGYVIQNHNFFDVPTSLPWLAGYPKGGEFIQMWSVLLTHNDMFADLAQVPFLLLGVYAIYEGAVHLGSDKKHARFAALLFIFLPIVLNQLKTTYVDVMLCSLFLAAIALIIKEKLRTLDFFLLGIIFSLLISVKSTGFLFVAVLIPLLFWNLYQHRTKKAGHFLRNYAKPLLFIAIPTVFGLYWYIKNYVLYGSPFYPFGFQALGFHIFPGQTFQEFAANAVNQLPGFPKSCTARIWFVWTEQKDWFGCMYNYDTNFAGLGPIWFILLIPALLVSVYVAIKNRLWLFFGVVATLIGLFAIYPSNYYSRYTMFITALGIYALALVFTFIDSKTTVFVKWLAIILALSVVGTNFVLCNFTPIVVRDQIHSVLAGSKRGAIYANIPGPAFVYLENRVQPGETVAYDSKPYFIYPLWRSDFKDRVVYVKAATAGEWYQGIQANRVRYVLTTPWSKERIWAKDKLTSIYKDDLYEIYQAY